MVPDSVLVLPEGTSFPPVAYLGILLIGSLLVAAGLYRRRPAMTDRTVVAVVPWICAGGILHALYQAGAYPPIVAPFFGTISVYLTVSILCAGTWIVGLSSTRSADRLLGAGGLVVVAGTIGYGFLWAQQLAGYWPGVILVSAVLLAGSVWLLLGRVTSATTTTAGATGQVVVFGHALDGISTAIGYEVLGATERSPVSRILLELGSALPGAEVLGDGWLFVLVKLGVASGIVVLFRGYIQDEPSEARGILTVLAAIGLGPGTYNLALYALI